MNKDEPKPLTDRQNYLYNFLVSVAEKYPNKWVSQKEVVDNINSRIEFFGRNPKTKYVYHEKDEVGYHNSCSAIWSDCEYINGTMFRDKIIITDGMCYKIATTPEEVDGYINALQIRLDRLSHRISCVKQKKGRANQGKVVSNNDTKMTPRAKVFHETYPKGYYQDEITAEYSNDKK